MRDGEKKFLIIHQRDRDNFSIDNRRETVVLTIFFLLENLFNVMLEG